MKFINILWQIYLTTFDLLAMPLLKLSNRRRMLEEEPGHRSAIIKSRLLTLLTSLSKDIFICILKYIYISPNLIKKAL